MYKNIVEVLKSKVYTAPSILIKNYRKLELTEKELVFILYIMNGNEDFNIKKITEELGYDKKEIMVLVSELTEKNIISLDMTEKKEVLNLEELYNKLCFLLLEKKEDNSDIYSLVESEFGRTLSAYEYELMKAWFENGYEEEMVREALKEAVYNQVLNIRYIDTILYEWNKKGYKKATDIKNEQKELKIPETVEYDWLNEDE